MTELRVLTVRQPWSEAIIFGGKDVENRVRNIAGDFRGTIAIHSAKRPATPEEWRAFDARFPDAMLRMAETVPWGQEEFGVIIGVVDLVDVHPARAAASGRMVDWDDHTPPGQLCSPWAEPDSYHLMIANPRPLAHPIPFRGALGLRRLDDETAADVWAAIRKEQ